MKIIQQWLLSINPQQATAFLLALSLLTRLPVVHLNNLNEQDSGRSALYYPVVGLLIGLLLYIPVLLLTGTGVSSPTISSSFLTASIIIVLWAIITGALHLDGLADSADGWLGGMGEVDKITKIMKDPRVGTAGVVALACLLLLKVSALTVLLQNEKGWLIIFAPVLARSFILLLFLTMPYASKQGMAKDVTDELPHKVASWIVGICMVIAAVLSFKGLMFALLGVWLLRRLMLKLLSGYSGDTIGATVEITEMHWLLGSAVLFGWL